MQRSLSHFSETKLLERLSTFVDQDRQTTAEMLVYIAEIDRRKLWVKHACPSMFAFCVERFRMSEAVAVKRIRAGRAASRFPVIFDMVGTGELHLSGVHQLAAHLTDANHSEVLGRAKHRTMREIDKLIAEIAPHADTPSTVRKLPRSREARSLVPLAPERYKIQITVGQETHDKLCELQELLSHQVPDGDPAGIIDRAFDALLIQARKKKAALTDRPRRAGRAATSDRGKGKPTQHAETSSDSGQDGCDQRGHKTRAIPAAIKRAVWKRDCGQCRFAGSHGNRCTSKRFLEFHHLKPFGRGGTHSASNIELRCRAHNQYEAEIEFGERFMRTKRSA